MRGSLPCAKGGGLRSKTEGLSVKALRRGEWWREGNTFSCGEGGPRERWMRRSFLTLRCPSPAYSTPHQITQHQILLFPLMPRGQILLPTVAKVFKSTARELRPLDSAAVCGRLCDEFCCGDFCVYYTGCFFSVRTEVVSRMALCGIW